MILTEKQQKISALSSGEEILPSNQGRVIEQANFT